MRRTARHPRQTISFTPLFGGINTAAAPHRLADGEMPDCLNYLYESGTNNLIPRGGLTPLVDLPTPILALYYDIDTNALFLFLTDRTVYLRSGTDTPRPIGTLSGTRLPTCAKFQNKLYIASGDRLQSYNYTDPIEELENAPICDLIFVRSGRLCAALTGSDRIRYSAIGDGTAWEHDPTDESTGGWLDIGYADSGDISAIVPLANDLIVFKTNGRIYQLSADSTPANWRVTELATDAVPAGYRCATHLKGNIVYLTDRGLVSLHATADYGNLAATDIGDKFRTLLAHPTDTARFFHLKQKGLLLIRPHENHHNLIAYHNALGSATRLTFAVPISDLIETKDHLLIASNRTLYQWTTDATDDDTAPIRYHIALRHLKSLYPLHLSAIYTDLTAPISATVTLSSTNPDHPLTHTLPANRRTYLRTNHTTDYLALTLTSNAPFTPNEIALQYSEL